MYMENKYENERNINKCKWKVALAERNQAAKSLQKSKNQGRNILICALNGDWKKVFADK